MDWTKEYNLKIYIFIIRDIILESLPPLKLKILFKLFHVSSVGYDD